MQKKVIILEKDIAIAKKSRSDEIYAVYVDIFLLAEHS